MLKKLDTVVKIYLGECVMDKNKFAVAFRKARLHSDLTFREIANSIGKSIGYLSEIEAGKKNPPERAIVENIERCLGIYDGHLVKLADEVRYNLPKSLNNLVTTKPELVEFLQLGEILLREDSSNAGQFNKILEILREKVTTGQIDEADKKLYLNYLTYEFSGFGGFVYE